MNRTYNDKMFIVTANPETFMMSENDDEMKNLLLDKETTLVPDGIGIVTAQSITPGTEVEEGTVVSLTAKENASGGQ